MKIHHVGYLVKNMEKAKAQFLALGYSVQSEPVFDPFRGVDIMFLEMDGYTVELVSPKTENSVVAKLIKTYKNAPYHICYETDDIQREVQKLLTKGFLQIDTPTEAPAIGGRKVCFMLGAGMGMIELLESGKGKEECN